MINVQNKNSSYFGQWIPNNVKSSGCDIHRGACPWRPTSLVFFSPAPCAESALHAGLRALHRCAALASAASYRPRWIRSRGGVEQMTAGRIWARVERRRRRLVGPLG